MTINTITIYFLTLLLTLATVAVFFYRQKYTTQNVRIIEHILSGAFVTKLLNKLCGKSSRKRNFANLLVEIKDFFQFQEISIHAISENSITHVAGDKKQIKAKDHLEQNIPILQSIVKHDSYYRSIIGEENLQLYVVPVNGTSQKMILSAITTNQNKLTNIDLEIITKSIKRILEICDILNIKEPSSHPS